MAKISLSAIFGEWGQKKVADRDSAFSFWPLFCIYKCYWKTSGDKYNVMMKRVMLLIFILVLIPVLFFIKKPNSSFQDDCPSRKGTLSIGNREFAVDVADTFALREKGLSGRESLQKGTGMFFVFEDDEIRNFWMKDMLFPLHIFWINKDLKVVGSVDTALPSSYPTPFSSLKPVRFVLEVSASEYKDPSVLIDEPIKFVCRR